ncbi:MAG TPA: YbaK/EbsC family protein [archaeon]|nr:YbaK/EbsC family protein [archaeon]
MSVSKKLTDYLKENGVDYHIIQHSVTYTAQETAASVNKPGKEVAKVVIISDGKEYAMAVVDAPHQVDMSKFAAVSGMKEPVLASESEIRKLFPDCEVGAMPPFGNLYGLKVFVDKSLEEDEMIIFNACSHFEALRMKYADFKKLAAPKVANIIM